MFKKKITYTNFNDEVVNEVLRFNLTELEIMDLAKEDPTFSTSYLKSLVESADLYEMFRFVRKILALSYGRISEDGNVFEKSEAIMNSFLHSAAYNALVDEIRTTDNVNILRDMLIGIFPPKFGQMVANTQADSPKTEE